MICVFVYKDGSIREGRNASERARASGRGGAGSAMHQLHQFRARRRRDAARALGEVLGLGSLHVTPECSATRMALQRPELGAEGIRAWSLHVSEHDSRHS